MNITKNMDKEMYFKMKKMKTVLAVVAALAVMATAMTGFAATVNTVTKYNMNSTYAGVTTTVSGATGDVTLLVTTTEGSGVNGSGILYVDQKTATGSDVVFDYSVVKSNINNLETEVILGTTGAAITQPEDGLGINALNTRVGDHYTVEFGWTAYGAGDGDVSASITAEEGYEITEIKIGGVVQPLQAGHMIAHEDLDDIIVTTQRSVQTPEMDEAVYAYAAEDDKYAGTAIIKISGDMSDAYETGVIYGGNRYKAIGEVNDNGYIAVKIIDAVEIAEGDLEAYFAEVAE